MLNKIPNIVVIILAAGASSRMGTPKQLLKWKNSTLLGHAIETAKPLIHSKLLVVLGANFELIKANISHDQIEIIKNDNWEAGLGKSIATGVRHILKSEIKFDAALIVLADQPLIDTSYLESMIAEFKEGAAQIITTAYKSGKKGVPVLFDGIYFEELSQLNDDKGAKAILRDHAEKVIIVKAGHDVSDIDTPTDYDALYTANH